MKYKKRALLLVILLPLLSPQPTMACDQCAERAIRDSFTAINEAIELVGKSIDAFADALDELKTQINESSSQISDSVDKFNDDVSNTLQTSAKDISKMISGLTTTIEGTLKLSQKINNDLSLSLHNHISDVAKKTMMQKLKNDSLYQAGGAFAHFEGGNKVTGLFYLYENSVRKAKALFVKNSQIIKDWNLKNEVVNANGRRARLKASINQINSQKDDLIFELSNSSVLTKESYSDFMTYLTIGLNPNQISPKNKNFVSLNTYQSQFLAKIMYKAPIVGLTEDNLAEIGDVLLVNPLPPEECPDTEVREESYCTSIYNILESLVFMPATPNYANQLSLASERAILEELNRSMTLANMLSRYENHLEAYYAEVRNFSN